MPAPSVSFFRFVLLPKLQRREKHDEKACQYVPGAEHAGSAVAKDKGRCRDPHPALQLTNFRLAPSLYKVYFSEQQDSKSRQGRINNCRLIGGLADDPGGKHDHKP